MNLTDEQLNVAMAEWMGWRRKWDEQSRQWIAYRPDGSCAYCDPDPDAEWEMHILPDFLSNNSPRRLLDEAEARLSDGQYDSFEQELARIVGFQCRDEWPVPSSHRPVISATARQRTIAILKTVKPEIFQ